MPLLWHHYGINATTTPLLSHLATSVHREEPRATHFAPTREVGDHARWDLRMRKRRQRSEEVQGASTRIARLVALLRQGVIWRGAVLAVVCSLQLC